MTATTMQATIITPQKTDAPVWAAALARVKARIEKMRPLPPAPIHKGPERGLLNHSAPMFSVRRGGATLDSSI